MHVHAHRTLRWSVVVTALLACEAAERQPAPWGDTFEGDAGTTVQVRISAVTTAADIERVLPGIACALGDVLFWPDEGGWPWPFQCTVRTVPDQIETRVIMSTVPLSGVLLIPFDEPAGRQVSGRLAGGLDVPVATSSTLRTVFGRGEFAVRRVAIDHPLRIDIVGRAVEPDSGLLAQYQSLLRSGPRPTGLTPEPNRPGDGGAPDGPDGQGR